MNLESESAARGLQVGGVHSPGNVTLVYHLFWIRQQMLTLIRRQLLWGSTSQTFHDVSSSSGSRRQQMPTLRADRHLAA